MSDGSRNRDEYGSHEGGEAGSNGDPPRIRRLSKPTVDRIAAGEVITRPARVVGELVDNALDAGASRVGIAVEGDGTESLRVRDDGRGMSRADAKLAIERHATSKLRDGEDPTDVAALGFRGEALPSIADAARLEILTNAGGAVGTRIETRPRSGAGVAGDAGDAGDAEDDAVTVKDAGRARGTTVIVEDLFANRPARRESLAGAAAEFARISALVTDYALARPDVAFTLEHDGRETFSTPGTGWTDAVLGVYDREVASRSTEIDATSRLRAGDGDATVNDDGAAAKDSDATANDADSAAVDLEVRGVLAYPSVSRASRDHVRIAVEGRPVEDARLERAVSEGYGRLLPDGREPVAAVDLRLPTSEVDPNVHPAKREVRLRRGEAVADAVSAVVEDALTGADLRRKAEVATDLETSLSAPSDASPFADVDPIGQYGDLYVLCDAGEELLVVDAHAAHERVNFERLRRAFETARDPSPEDPSPEAVVPLDPPATVSLSSDERAAMEAHREDLRRVGFDSEAFGGSTVRLRSVPAPFGRAADVEAFRDALSTLAAGGRPDDPREELLADLACHPSLKRGDAMTDAEMGSLLDRLGECDRPFSCPHGRPTVLSIEEATLADGFDRPTRR
ncbi:DNA mismatch repair endonuclease MutL [Halopenitus salinus]|uniref:DNA mismatch repair protein MutL n=1 Tax=Halopenitus salinus TaxID=1198295 RepID=A0ABD5URF1_9EURY